MSLLKKILKTNKERYIITPKTIAKRDIEIEAYFIAKADGNKKSPNLYWFEAERKLLEK